MPELCTAVQRQRMLRLLKHGPALGDREKLADYARDVYRTVTGKELRVEVEKMMDKWRSNYDPIQPDQTYIY